MHDQTKMKIDDFRAMAEEWDEKSEAWKIEGLELAPFEAKIMAGNYRAEADRLENET